MDQLWLGYDGLVVPFAHVAAVLRYTPVLDNRIIQVYGRVPSNIRAVVILGDGAYLPSSWSVEQLRQRLARWRTAPA